MVLGFFHHLGSFLLLAACVLLIITTITAPVIKNLAILRVDLQNGDTVNFGTFGYCILSDAGNTCTNARIGYSPVPLLDTLGAGDYGSASKNTADALTRVMVLHPVACGLAFLAFLASLGASIFGSLCAALISSVAWLITLVVLITDFVAWGIVKKKVNDDGNSHASFEVGIWTLLAAFVVLFLGTVLVLLTCCSGRREKKRGGVRKAEPGFVDGPGRPARRRWYQRR
ncbi:hypothetical protein V499_07988 [Pseudogymnoascus sp. VKM F-103]|uniref:Regulator of ime2 n=1 Tax=Pseudogymnoascus verrucosus TaxID=342668 RepID=A0A1B8GYA5_9PEZI|nr:uncharacterized protein VE01_01276 [Pseudogymnoascus verrucosus]KFY71842.1 hypothetical protein V499_07988 [Pseudogymnoascus sp. VKM F-103]OBU00806.1 hypothetical protein VE01_01276 [Pseudogymnoascus verrucosus]